MNNLDQAQRDLLLQALEDLRALLEDTLTQTAVSADTVMLDQQRLGRVSRVDALQQQNMAQANEHQARQRLKQVLSALRLYEEDPDEYGLCRSCDNPIGFARLQVRPETPLCIKCQQSAENN
ncbi:TraR/DksA family transcriptional regulator [Spongorhabdus nitratireducens]